MTTNILIWHEKMYNLFLCTSRKTTCVIPNEYKYKYWVVFPVPTVFGIPYSEYFLNIIAFCPLGSMISATRACEILEKRSTLSFFSMLDY